MAKDYLNTFSEWLTVIDIEGKPQYWCKFCNCSIRPKKDNVFKHSNSKKHRSRESLPVHEGSSESFHGKYEICETITEEIPEESTDASDPNHTMICQSEKSISSGHTVHSYIQRKRKKPSSFYLKSDSTSEVSIKPEEDELEIFGKFITAQLRKLPEEHAVTLTLEIHGLIAQKRFKALADKDTQTNSEGNPQVITVYGNESYSN